VYLITIVTDENFGERVLELACNTYVWLVRSAVNDAAAQAFWKSKQPADDPILHGLSTFDRTSDESTDEMLARLLDLIDDHHGVYAHDPAWTEINVIGVPASPAFEAAARTYGVNDTHATAEGFRVSRAQAAPTGP
jgi:hypothetical protein